MRAQAEFPKVAEAVRAYAMAQEHAIEADRQLFHQLAEGLNIALAEGTREQQDDMRKFAGQVRRALNKLADDGVLVKQSNGHDVRFYTPDGLRRHLEEEASREMEELVLAGRVRDLRDRIGALGITGTISADGHGQLTMDLDTVAALVALAERLEQEYLDAQDGYYSE